MIMNALFTPLFAMILFAAAMFVPVLANSLKQNARSRPIATVGWN
jgi:uncharacterized membrane protein